MRKPIIHVREPRNLMIVLAAIFLTYAVLGVVLYQWLT